MRLKPTFCSASGPPRSGYGPASPGSFKLTSDRYRGMGAAERLPSTSERDTEMPEVERSARKTDEKDRRRPEIHEVNRRRRRPLPEFVEDCRGLPNLTQRACSSSRPRLYSRTPRPIATLGWATPNPQLASWACVAGAGGDPYVARLQSLFSTQPFWIDWCVVEAKGKTREFGADFN